MNDATSRVESAVKDGRTPTRKDVEHALREIFGLSSRQARRFAAEYLRGRGADEPDVRDLAERIASLEQKLGS